MCRSIKRLRRPGDQPSDAELREAALQFVRKISGYRHPSQTNQAAFDRAVDEVVDASRLLFNRLSTKEAKRKISNKRLRSTAVKNL